jgi:hypothetical protein
VEKNWDKSRAALFTFSSRLRRQKPSNIAQNFKVFYCPSHLVRQANTMRMTRTRVLRSKMKKIAIFPSSSISIVELISISKSGLLHTSMRCTMLSRREEVANEWKKKMRQFIQVDLWSLESWWSVCAKV